MLEFSYEVSAQDVENPYHHLHHADCLKFLERGRLDALCRVGHASEDYLKQEIYLVISSISVQYLREVLQGTIRVVVENPKIVGKALIIDQRLFNQRNKLAISAQVQSVFMDGRTRRAMQPPEAFVDSFLRL